MPFMQTTTGQHLYYELAPLTMGRGPQIEQPLKQVYTSSPFTERALRSRMKDMADQGLLATCSVSPDGRNKSLMPTEKFQDYVYDHAREAHWLLNEKFHLLERD